MLYLYTDRQRPLQDCDSDGDRVMAESGKESDVSIYPSGASTPQSEYNMPPFHLLRHVFAWLSGLSCVYVGMYKKGSTYFLLYIATATCKRKCDVVSAVYPVPSGLKV